MQNQERRTLFIESHSVYAPGNLPGNLSEFPPFVQEGMFDMDIIGLAQVERTGF